MYPAITGNTKVVDDLKSTDIGDKLLMSFAKRGKIFIDVDYGKPTVDGHNVFVFGDDIKAVYSLASAIIDAGQKEKSRWATSDTIKRSFSNSLVMNRIQQAVKYSVLSELSEERKKAGKEGFDEFLCPDMIGKDMQSGFKQWFSDKSRVDRADEYASQPFIRNLKNYKRFADDVANARICEVRDLSLGNAEATKEKSDKAIFPLSEKALLGEVGAFSVAPKLGFEITPSMVELASNGIEGKSLSYADEKSKVDKKYKISKIKYKGKEKVVGAMEFVFMDVPDAVVDLYKLAIKKRATMKAKKAMKAQFNNAVKNKNISR